MYKEVCEMWKQINFSAKLYPHFIPRGVSDGDPELNLYYNNIVSSSIFVTQNDILTLDVIIYLLLLWKVICQRLHCLGVVSFDSRDSLLL